MRPIKVMITEDELIIAVDLSQALENKGFQVCGLIASGQEAVAEVEKQRPDVVLMDIQLPGKLDGVEAARQIQERYGTAVLYITGGSEKAIMEQGRQVKPGDCFVKPINLEELMEKIMERCRGRD